MKAPAIRVQCQECNKRFSTRSMSPECPNCHGVDIDVADDRPLKVVSQ